MKKLLVFTFTALLGVSLAFAQDTGGDKDKSAGSGKGKIASGKKATKAKKGAKGKKSSGGTTTPAPK